MYVYVYSRYFSPRQACVRGAPLRVRGALCAHTFVCAHLCVRAPHGVCVRAGVRVCAGVRACVCARSAPLRSVVYARLMR
jgi:hypothetical protein